MSLKSGSWKLNINGTEGVLQINTVGADGNVAGVISLGVTQQDFRGVWDATARNISFHPSVLSPSATSICEFFQGLLFSTPSDPEPGQDFVWTLVGSVEVTDLDTLKGGYKGNARRHKFGWFANIAEVA